MTDSLRTEVDPLDISTLHELAAARSQQNVSLLFPTERAGRETRQGPIHLQNLLRAAQAHARAIDADLGDVLEPARALLDDADFWQHQADGLAIFANEEACRVYRVPTALPELAIVGPRFQLAPLLRVVDPGARFWLLKLSQNSVELCEGSRYALRPRSIEGLPGDLAEALRFDDPEKSLQAHSVDSRRTTPGARAPQMFHGHGANVDAHDDELRRFVVAVDRALIDATKDETRPPMLLAAVDFFLPLYRQHGHYPHLLDGIVAGNPETLAPHDLHAAAWAIAEPQLFGDRERDLAQLAEALAKDAATAELPTILAAAEHGRIAKLFVARDAQVWGRLQSSDTGPRVETRGGTRQPGDIDLVNAAVVDALVHGGDVFEVDAESLPKGRSAAAVMRY